MVDEGDGLTARTNGGEEGDGGVTGQVEGSELWGLLEHF